MNISLLPYTFKTLGWIILLPTTILSLFVIAYDYSFDWLNIKTFSFIDDGFGIAAETNLTNTILGSLFIIGALFVSFSKEKIEDEYISSLRLSSLMWAVFINYAILLVCFLFVYGLNFLDIMVYNMFTVLIIFILRFHYLVYKNSKNTL